MSAQTAGPPHFHQHIKSLPPPDFLRHYEVISVAMTTTGIGRRVVGRPLTPIDCCVSDVIESAAVAAAAVRALPHLQRSAQHHSARTN